MALRAVKSDESRTQIGTDAASCRGPTAREGVTRLPTRRALGPSRDNKGAQSLLEADR
jgi:hypothetical protein